MRLVSSISSLCLQFCSHFSTAGQLNQSISCAFYRAWKHNLPALSAPIFSTNPCSYMTASTTSVAGARENGCETT